MPNKQQAKGGVKEMQGKVQKNAGRMMNNEDMEDKGRARQTKGAVEKGVGNMKDKAKGVADKLRGK